MTVVDAFLEQRSTLLGVAYRMLGSWSDAEDVVQEAWLRWSAAEEVEAPAAWLRTVVTRLCLDQLRSAHVRRESDVGPWLPEPVPSAALGPLETAELRDSVTLAFLLVLERLTVDVEDVNGSLAVVARRDGAVSQVVAFDVVGDRVRSRQISSSPATLQALS